MAITDMDERAAGRAAARGAICILPVKALEACVHSLAPQSATRQPRIHWFTDALLHHTAALHGQEAGGERGELTQPRLTRTRGEPAYPAHGRCAHRAPLIGLIAPTRVDAAMRRLAPHASAAGVAAPQSRCREQRLLDSSTRRPGEFSPGPLADPAG
jgi:hypothetical protein